MNCDRVREQVQAQLWGDGEFSAREELNAHLAQCSACAREAETMAGLTYRLQSGLRNWVDEGMAPPDLEQQLRLAVRSAVAVDVEEVLREAEELPSERETRKQIRQREVRRTFWTVAAAAAVAALLFVSLPTGHEMASRLPLVGALIQFGRGAKTLPGETPVNLTVTSGDVTLRLTQVLPEPEATRVIYTLEGIPGGLAGRDARDLAGELLAGGKRLQLVSLAIVRDANGIPSTVEATYGPTPAGQPITFRIDRLPGVNGGPWEVGLPVK